MASPRVDASWSSPFSVVLVAAVVATDISRGVEMERSFIRGAETEAGEDSVVVIALETRVGRGKSEVAGA